MINSDLYTQITALPLLQGISAEHIVQMRERGILRIVSMDPEEGDIIVIGQIRGDSILSETSPMVYHADTMELTALEAFGDDGKVGNTVNSIDIKAYVEEMATSASVQTESQEEADGTEIIP